MKTITLICGFLLFALTALSAQVDTVEVFSTSMNKTVKTVIILPEAYASKKDLPVVYLLHGYGGNYSDWINRAPRIKELADQYAMIIACPDGGKGSWYWNSPIDTSFQYETFVVQELVEWIDKNYNTLKSRAGRAISGLSMGGHGSLYLAFRHQDVFGAAGSTAGGVDIRPFPKNWDIEQRLGSYVEFPKRWEEHNVINMLHLLTPGSLKLIIDCGTSDFFYRINQKLHEKMLLRNIDHTYITGPGAHNWKYWENSIVYQLLFMHQYFEENAKRI